MTSPGAPVSDAPSPPALDELQPAGEDRVRERLLAAGEVILCSSIPTQIVLGGLLGLAGISPLTADGAFSLGFVLTLSLADTVLVIGLMAMITRAHGESVSELWFGRRAPLREVLHGLALVPLLFVVVVLLMATLRQVAPWLHNVEVNPLEELAAGGALQAALFALIAIFAGGVREELQRAFLVVRFERHLGGPVVGVIVLSVAFGLLHSVQGWDAVIVTGTLGAFWAIVYLRRRSSVAPIVSHAGFNSLEVLRVALVGV